MKIKDKLIVLLILLLINFSSAFADEIKQAHQIKLILQITVDGLRGDLLDRYKDNFSENGFNYLLKTGVVYKNAHYQHANTETIVGHSTLATGTFPSLHGMTGNAWYDSATGELSYNIEDPDYPILPSRDKVVPGEQVDPTQKLARTMGRSPNALLAETLTDRLKAYYGGKSKIFAVSGKDRGAVPMAGKTGKAFWMSTDTGDFVTSKYYYENYPNWTKEWNENRFVEKLGGSKWNLLNKQDSYLLGHQDNRDYEVDLKGFGKVFPHQFAKAGNPYLPTQVLVSPEGDRLTLDFAKTLFTQEGLGKDAIPDYLGISFSGVDAVNHFFGPSSLENEDIVLQLDRTLSELFSFISNTVGLSSTLIILSSDHGMAEMPEYMSELGYQAGRIYSEEIEEVANKLGKEKYNIDNIVKYFFRPYLYLDSEIIVNAKLNSVEVRKTIAKAITRLKGVKLAISRDDISSIDNRQLVKQIQRNFHKDRSGDIYIVQQPYWFNFEKGHIAVMHGSPWSYDTHVPIIFAGAGMQNKLVHRLVHPIDIAPTISAKLGMTSPSSTRGAVLEEVFY